MTTETQQERFQTIARNLEDDELYAMLKALEHAEFHRDGFLLPHVRESGKRLLEITRAEYGSRSLHYSIFESEEIYVAE